MKMASSSIISTMHYLNTEQSKYSNCTVNLGQTRVFYKAGQTRLTQSSFNPGTYLHTVAIYAANIKHKYVYT